MCASQMENSWILGQEDAVQPQDLNSGQSWNSAGIHKLKEALSEFRREDEDVIRCLQSYSVVSAIMLNCVDSV